MSTLDKFELTKDLYLFCRQLTFKLLYQHPSTTDGLTDLDRQALRDLMELLDENENYQGRKKFSGRLPSQVTPSFSLFSAIQIFFDKTSRDIQDLKVFKHRQNNLSKEERRALSNLKSNDLFEIKEADKGGNIVLWPKDMYCLEAKRQLCNPQHYVALPSDPTSVFKSSLDRLLSNVLVRGIIDKKELDYLIVKFPVTPTFYMLPKVHKSLSNPPGRPIVSGIGGLFERACIYVDFFLQPIVLNLESYIRDSSFLIQQLDTLEVPDNTILATFDVEALYTSINHDLGILAVSYYLDKFSMGNRGHDSFILDLLRMILERNYFVFDRVYYKQVSGTAMGARCAPSYANLFMGWWEETQVKNSPLFCNNVLKWFCFIDDIVVLWTGSMADLETFVGELNSNCVNIRLASHFSTSSVDFLDLKIMLQDNRIYTTLFRKGTATNNLLHYSSFHPRHLRNSIPKCQFLRLRRNCSQISKLKQDHSLIVFGNVVIHGGSFPVPLSILVRSRGRRP
ncbi:uncharacterized protein LOC143787335 [Ranitomeya variabilis]|uniref:uncharacterized protein LOC143787335 n=1 Tax=Ranitomeya variabilis TaxID=490064 RepID=UPI004056594F